MRTREKSKASLISEVKTLTGLYNLEKLKAEKQARTIVRLETEKKQVMDELVEHAKHLNELSAAKQGVEAQMKGEMQANTDLRIDRDWCRGRMGELKRELRNTQEALRTLATTTGRIGKADDVRQVSYTDTTSH